MSRVSSSICPSGLSICSSQLHKEVYGLAGVHPVFNQGHSSLVAAQRKSATSSHRGGVLLVYGLSPKSRPFRPTSRLCYLQLQARLQNDALDVRMRTRAWRYRSSGPSTSPGNRSSPPSVSTGRGLTLRSCVRQSVGGGDESAPRATPPRSLRTRFRWLR